MVEFKSKTKHTFSAQRVKPSKAILSSPKNRDHHAQIQAILRATGAQAKLTIGQPNDKYEQEADRVADRVMRMSDADVAQRVEIGTIQPMQIQRMCTECEEEQAVQRQPEEEEEQLQAKFSDDRIQRQEEEEEEALQTKGTPGQTPQVGSGVESRINSLKGGGQPLDPATRSFFEPRFGHDFSHVRVHADSNASETAKSVNARAFTLGNNVVFGSGEYQLQSREGKRLLGHELTHIIQQGQNSSNSNIQTIQRTVFKCCRDLETGTWADAAASFFGLKHCWIRTDRKEAGMGPADDGPLPANPLGISTKIIDHRGEKGTCSTYPSADEECVNKRLQIGKRTGNWYPWNNCNTLVGGILHACDEEWQVRNDAIGDAYAEMDFCWVAREVIPERWTEVRSYLLGEAPAWLRETYGRYGQQFASFIHNKPWLKKGLRPLFEHWADKGVVLGGRYDDSHA